VLRVQVTRFLKGNLAIKDQRKMPTNLVGRRQVLHRQSQARRWSYAANRFAFDLNCAKKSAFGSNKSNAAAVRRWMPASPA
jgi:hypothetical protein